jgi:preprotein translocase subunit YajC
MFQISSSGIQRKPLLLAASLLLWAAPSLADGAPAASAGPGQAPGLGSMLVPFALMLGVMWLLVLRPQKKKMQEQQSMLGALKHGDDVLTASGILGKVTGITEKFVTLEIADDVRVKMLKSQISQVLKDQKIKDLAQ